MTAVSHAITIWNMRRRISLLIDLNNCGRGLNPKLLFDNDLNEFLKLGWWTGLKFRNILYSNVQAAAVAQTVRVFASHAVIWVFESQPRQTWVIETGSESATTKHSALGVSVTGPLWRPYKRMSCVTVGAKEPSLLNGHEFRV